jgi:hypothetical protein
MTGQHIGEMHMHNNVTTPSGELPDGRVLMAQLEAEFRRTGR